MLSVTADRQVGPRRAGGRAAFGVGTGWDGAINNTSVTLRRVPARLGAYLAIPAGPGRIEPGLDAGADLLLVSGASGSRVAPLGDVTVGYALPLLRHLFVRVMARGGVALPYTFQDTPTAPHTVWSTPRTFLEFGVESGVSFP
jgi:hypothetical protein